MQWIEGRKRVRVKRLDRREQLAERLGVFDADEGRPAAPGETARLVLLSQSAGRVKPGERLAIDNSNGSDDRVLVHAQDDVAALGIELLVPDLEVVRLLDVDVEVLPREAWLRPTERWWNRVTECTGNPAFGEFRACPDLARNP